MRSSRRATRATTSGATPTTSTLLAELGFGAYRFSLEWSRIEPEEGEFSTRRARPLPPDARGVPRPRPAPGRHVPPLHDAPLGRGRRRLGRTPRSSTGSPGSASAPSRTSATTSGWRCTINEPNVVSLIGYRHGRVPARRDSDLDGVRNGVNEHLHRRAPARRTTRSRPGPGDFPVGLTVVDERLWPPRAPRHARRVPRTCTRTSSSRRRAATTSSACRRTRAPGSAETGMPLGPEAGRRDARHGLRVLAAGARGGDPPRRRRRPAARSTSPRTASAPTTTSSGSATSPTRSAASAAASTTASTCAATSTGRCSTTSSGRSATGRSSGSSPSTARPRRARSSPARRWLGEHRPQPTGSI